MWFSNKYDEQYEKCKKDIEDTIKEKGKYKFDKKDKCYNMISDGSFMEQYRHKFVMEHNNFIKGKLCEFEKPEFRKCIDTMKEKVDKNKISTYYKDGECHDELFNYKSKTYHKHIISDKVTEYSGSCELVTNKYIGFTITKN